MTLVQELDNFLANRKWGISKVTELTGIPSERIRQWLRGKGNPKAEDAAKVRNLIDGKYDEGAQLNPASDARQMVSDETLMWRYIDLTDRHMRLHEELMRAKIEIAELSVEKRFLENKLLSYEKQLNSDDGKTMPLHTSEDADLSTDYLPVVPSHDDTEEVPSHPGEQDSHVSLDKSRKGREKKN